MIDEYFDCFYQYCGIDVARLNRPRALLLLWRRVRRAARPDVISESAAKVHAGRVQRVAGPSDRLLELLRELMLLMST